MSTAPSARRFLLSLLSLACVLMFGATAAYPHGDDRGHGTRRVACGDLTSLSFEGNTTVTAATNVTSGTLVTPNNLTLTNLPAFCRVQAVSRPSSESNIYFEVWLPISTWNGKFLSSGEGGYAGAPNYTRLGLDGGLDELVRRGYATASTDTGHLASDTWWAVGRRRSTTCTAPSTW